MSSRLLHKHSFKRDDRIFGEGVHQPDEPTLGSVGEVPSVGGEILPADVLRVMPQSADLKQIKCRR